MIYVVSSIERSMWCPWRFFFLPPPRLKAETTKQRNDSSLFISKSSTSCLTWKTLACFGLYDNNILSLRCRLLHPAIRNAPRFLQKFTWSCGPTFLHSDRMVPWTSGVRHQPSARIPSKLWKLSSLGSGTSSPDGNRSDRSPDQISGTACDGFEIVGIIVGPNPGLHFSVVTDGIPAIEVIHPSNWTAVEDGPIASR